MHACIAGAGPQGRVILDVFRSNGYDAIDIADDDPALAGQLINGVTILGSLAYALQELPADTGFIVAIGNPHVRLAIAARIESQSRMLINAIHRSAVVTPSATLGVGNMVGATAVINSNAQVGNHTIINTGAVVEHDCLIADGAAVSPGAHLGGRVSLGTCAFVATGAIVLSRVKVGARSVVAAGAVVTRDVPDDVLVMGAPARIHRQLGADFDWKRVL